MSKLDLDAVLQKLRKLNEPVPKPLSLPTSGEVDNAQQRLGVVVHPDYRKYLLEASDVVFGTKEHCTIVSGGGYTDLVDVAMAAWNEVGVPRYLLPVCEDNGDYFCMDQSGAVVFWSHDGSTDERWPDLASWIKEAWTDEEQTFGHAPHMQISKTSRTNKAVPRDATTESPPQTQICHRNGARMVTANDHARTVSVPCEDVGPSVQLPSLILTHSVNRISRP